MSNNIVGYLQYITQEGDTFDCMALMAYNEERMATYIIKANLEYVETIIFDAGVSISIPILENIESNETLPPWRR